MSIVALTVNALLIALIVLGLLVAVAYILAKSDICFTFGKEGAAKIIVRAGSGSATGAFDHVLLFWSGHRLNDPRRLFPNRNQPTWEVLPVPGQPNAKPSPYAWWQLHWRFFALFGIYWFGLYPFKRVYRYEFEWTEQKIGEDGQPCPWHRKEETNFTFVKPFPYWVRLKEAEDKDNLPLDLDYLNRVRINNPYKALFGIEDWLDQGTADSNNRARVWVGENTFDDIKDEKEEDGTRMSGLARAVSSINENLLNSPGEVGAPEQYGMTVVGVSLVSVSPAGKVSVEVEEALAAKRLSELKAKGVIAEAEGYAEATRTKAKGDADATRTRAEGDAAAVETVYSRVQQFGEFGLAMRSLETLDKAAASPNTTMVWANNPFADILRGWFPGVKVPEPASPPANTNEPQT